MIGTRYPRRQSIDFMHNARVRQLVSNDRTADTLRVLLALGALILYCGLLNEMQLMVPLLLGVIASALAETDDSWRRRLSALLATLLCFGAAALMVEVLIEHPPAFAVALTLGSFLLVLLGAVGPRYGTIAHATLLLAVYSMIEADHPAPGTTPWHTPILLVLGAAWYGLVALAWNGLFVQQPVRQALGRLYEMLGDYLDCKSQLFEPARDLDEAGLRAELARINVRVVDALNETRNTLIDRLNSRRARAPMDEHLRLYLTAQDIHERITSSHSPYRALGEALFHSDVLFRCQRLIRLLGRACRDRARALQRHQAYVAAPGLALALEDLEGAVKALAGEAEPRGMPRVAAPHAALHAALQGIVENVAAIYRDVERGHGATADHEQRLQDPGPRSLRDAWQRLCMQVTPTSARFRHALRLALAMLTGYIVLRMVHPQEGYWILLTVMLVCQPSFGATRRRLVQRIAGTAVGLFLGWALLMLVTDNRWQLLLTVLAGGVFFAARFKRYLTATAAISVLVLLTFNQVGNGFELIWPRLLDTLLGGTIAATAMFLVLPDWRARELRQLLADALDADARYLRAIFNQYRAGKQDNLPYRIARRDAHNADAAVSSHVAAALADPGGRRTDTEHALEVLTESQTLISHLSTLGAHRGALPPGDGLERLERSVEHTATTLETIAVRLRSTAHPTSNDAGETLVPLEDGDQAAASEPDLAAAQLRLLDARLPRLQRLAAALQRHPTSSRR